jgi:CRP-like cAMP-binding protein/Fe-S-cluster-containing dehydrogenase component/thioredoxin reductase
VVAGRYPLRPAPAATSLGRARDCDVPLAESTISRLHAEIVWEGDALLLVHRSRVNPTRLNGRPVSDRERLVSGDEIQLAEGVVLRLELASAAAPIAPTPEPAPPPPAAPAAPGPPSAPAPHAAPAVAPHAAPAVVQRPDSAERRAPAGRDGEGVEVAIVGAGPAGLAAAVQAAKRGISHVVLERSSLAHTVERYQKGKWVMDEPPRLPLQPDLAVRFEAATREEVLARWQADVRAAGAKLRVGPEHEVVRLERTDDGFHLGLRGGGSLRARHVVLAIGVQGNLRSFGVPGDDLPHVAYQLDDPAEHAGKRVVVVGVGDAGIENALALAEHDAEVTVVNRGSEIVRAKARNSTLLDRAIKSERIRYLTNSAPERFEPNAVVLSTDAGELRLEADLVIGRLGAIPPRRFLEQIGVELPSEDPAAVPEVSEAYESNLPGLHIVGALAGYPLIKNCLNQGYEVIERILGQPVVPADEPVLRERLAPLGGTVAENLAAIRSRVPLFAGLTTVQLRELLFDSELRRVRAGEPIFRRGDYTNSFLAILRGSVDVELPNRDSDANIDLRREETLTRSQSFVAGEFFGEAGLLTGRPQPGTATAREECVLLECSRLAIQRLVRSVEGVRRVIDETTVDRALEAFVPEVPAPERKRLAAAVEIRRLRSGEYLFRAGDAPEGVHLIRRGTVKVSAQWSGRDVVIEYAQAGGFVGERALLAPDRRRTASAAATVPTETIFVPAKDFVALLSAHPEVESKLHARERVYEKNEAENAAYTASMTVHFMINETGAHEATDILLIDESLCIRCNQCEKACAETHDGISRLDREAGPTYQRRGGGQIHVPTACQHCENPKCMEDCPPDAIRRGAHGEVYIMDNCIGCGNCVTNCPYDVIQMAAVVPYRSRNLLFRLLFGERPPVAHDPGSALKKAVKCDLCRQLPKDRHGKPQAACVSACPTGAIVRVPPRRFVDEIRVERA